MYGQGSYNSQFGRGPPTPMPPPYHQQQQLPGRPPLLSHFQQGHPIPPSSVFQPGPPIYQQGHSIPPAAGHQIPPDAAPSTSQLYLHTQPTLHGSLLPHIHSTDQQNKQLPSHLGTENAHHMSVLIRPHPPRAFPPLQPATMYRVPMHQQSQQPGSAQDLQHIPLQPPPPPPPTSSSFTSNPFGGFVPSTGKNSHMPSVAPLLPPPPPSEPPPIPPSPPPSTSPLLSSTHQQAASNLTGSNKPCDSEVSTSGYIEKGVTTYEVRHNVPEDGGALNQKVSQVGDSLLLRGSVMLDLPSPPPPPPPPPKPTEEKVIQKIQDLCQLIAKNGPGYEDFVCQNESGNPEFEFLFVGDPGSDAAIAHEYFLWMKKKCIFAVKCNEGKGDSPSKPSETVSSMQPNRLEVPSRTYSLSDSDMEMEDDINQSGNNLGVNHSTEGINNADDLIHSELDVKEQSHKQQMSECESLAFAAPVLVKHGQEVVSSHEQLAFGRPVSTICSPVSNSANQQPLTSNLKKSATASVDGKSLSGTSAAAQGLNSERKSSQITKGGSPFRLLQDYASEDISENDEDPEYVSPLKYSSSAGVGAASLHINARLNASLKAVNFLEGSGREVKKIAIASISSGTTDELVNDKHENRASISHAESPQDFQQKHALAVGSVEVCLNGKLLKESEEKGAKSASNSHKVDEFGRLVREGASESDSDDSRYNGRQRRRGRSRSRSPLDRRRRSPRRRRDKRSRSRSWSPRNRRSRSRSPRRRRNSRSPTSRHMGEVSGDGMRRGKGQIPECFDFRRGRCYRGASCRYLHHNSHKREGTNCHRSKQQYLENPLLPKDYNIHGDVKHNLLKASNQQHREVKISDMQLGQDMASSNFVARKDMHVYQKRENSVNDASQSGSFDQDSQLIASQSTRSASSREAAAKRLQTHVLPQEESKMLTTVTNNRCQEAMESTRPIYDDDKLKSHVDTCKDTLPMEDSLTNPSQSKLSDPLLQNADCPPQQTDNSSIFDSFPAQTSLTSVNKIPVTDALPNTIDFGHHSAQLLPPPPPALSEGAIAQHMIRPLGDYNLIPKSTSFSSQSSVDRFPSYMLPNQQPHFSSSIATWAPLPPPPPPPSVSSQLQQSHLPPRNDFGSQIRQYAAELPTQVGGFPQQACPPVQEPNRSISHAEDFRLKRLPPYNLPGDQFSVPTLLKEAHLTHLPQLELSSSEMQSFPANNLPPGELLKSSSQTHPYLQQPQLPHGLHHPASVSPSSRYPSDLQEGNQSSYPPDFSRSRNSTYYNPYASTFEQPPSSKFSSDVFRHEDTTYNTKYASPFSTSHVQDDGRDIGSDGSRQATSSPNSAKAVGKNFPRSGGDQYDPLLDSIEPSSSLPKKVDNVQKWEPSSIMLRHSGSNKPLDVEENNKKKEIGGIALATSVDNEEYGETADAEVGAVESGSPSNPIEAPSMDAGEIEIDQIKSPGKNKKDKESRSMKLFKVALADFVKEVLKPSWRQGNMSKEAFKTIVKKTVDKVSGAMKSHQIPKSRAKIDQYIVSSQWKLTKLVTGYVDKYVKM